MSDDVKDDTVAGDDGAAARPVPDKPPPLPPRVAEAIAALEAERRERPPAVSVGRAHSRRAAWAEARAARAQAKSQARREVERARAERLRLEEAAREAEALAALRARTEGPAPAGEAARLDESGASDQAAESEALAAALVDEAARARRAAAEEEARQRAEEEARQRAEEEARQRAEEESAVESPPEEDDHARRWAEAEAAILKAQEEQRERAARAIAAQGGVVAQEEPDVEPEPEAKPEAGMPEPVAEGKPAAKVEVKPAAKTDDKPARTRSLDIGSLRSQLASVIWLIAVLGALVLAVGALCVALELNQDNSVVSAVLDLSHRIDLNELKKFEGSEVVDSSAAVKSALVNFGIAALVWLGAGKILDKLIRP